MRVYSRNQKKFGDKINLICFYITLVILILLILLFILKVFVL